jgi:hypothetical protein
LGWLTIRSPLLANALPEANDERPIATAATRVFDVFNMLLIPFDVLIYAELNMLGDRVNETT